MQMGERDGRMDGPGPMGEFSGRHDNEGRGFGREADGMMGHAPLLLLADDLTVEMLNNMTLNEIRDLQEGEDARDGQYDSQSDQRAERSEDAREKQYDFE